MIAVFVSMNARNTITSIPGGTSKQITKYTWVLLSRIKGGCIMEKRKLRALKLKTTEYTDSVSLVITDDDLATLQQFVGGNINTVRIAPDVVMIVNDEGLLRCLPINGFASPLYGHPIVGNAWIFGIDSEGELQDVPDRYLSKVLDILITGEKYQ